MTITAATTGLASPAKAANLGDSQIFTKIPTPPGYPEGIAVSNDQVYVCGPAVLGNFQPSQVLSYDLNGNFLQSYGVQNQNFSQ
ncbi:MAG TPA: hypothetical protein VK203_14780, partial [Nostocaceae cyanobacterium]|nr:hypothetical protein [Nostocaceae cyanobacterium]